MAIPEKTGRNQDGTFTKGVSGNPAGKPKGARHQLTENFVKALNDEEPPPLPTESFTAYLTPFEVRIIESFAVFFANATVFLTYDFLTPPLKTINESVMNDTESIA